MGGAGASGVLTYSGLMKGDRSGALSAASPRPFTGHDLGPKTSLVRVEGNHVFQLPDVWKVSGIKSIWASVWQMFEGPKGGRGGMFVKDAIGDFAHCVVWFRLEDI